MDVTGKIKIKPQYDWGAPFSEGLAVVRDKKTKKYGYINLKGEYVIKPQFEQAGDFSDGLALVADDLKNNKQRFINKKGKTVIELPKDAIVTQPFYHGLARIVEPEKYKGYYINKKGEIIKPH